MQNPKDTGSRATSERLSDIAYFESIASREVQAVAQRLRTSINPAEDPAAQIESLIHEASRSLGHLGARLQIVETVLANRSEPGDTGDDDPTPVPLVPRLLETAEHWNGVPNLLDLELDAQRRPFRWSGAQRTIRFRLPVERSRNRGLRITVVALIKQEYLRNLQLLVDGAPVPYELRYLDGANHLLATLPRTDSQVQTNLDILLPATHSPLDLGTSSDKRKLGIALHAVEVTARAPTDRRGFGGRLRQLKRSIGL